MGWTTILLWRTHDQPAYFLTCDFAQIRIFHASLPLLFWWLVDCC
jgi:hypothetical protein